MKNFLSLVLLFTAATWAAPLERDEDCEMEWVTVFTAATTTSTIPTSSSIALAGGEEKTALGQARSSSSAVLTSASSTPSMTVAPVDSTDSPSPDTKGIVTTNDAGEAGIPIDGPHLSAPVSNVAVPADAKTYTPPSKVISGKALETWMREQAKLKPASKWLKIAPGVYNIDCKDNIVFSFMDGLTEKWTIDMRGVTFLVAGTCQAIYINQCEDFTIYGGTLWFDAGEVWTQAKVTSIEGGTVTCVVDEGYDLATWRKAGPRNLNAMDSSDPNHFVRPKGLNYWFASDFNFDSLDSERTWTMHVGTKEVPLQVGYTMTMQTGGSMGNTIGSENNRNLHINGFTSNGGLSQYGLGSKGTATFEDIYYVNAPPRPGFAPRVEGPKMSQGHIE